MDIFVLKDGQQLGPFPETKIREGIDAGEFAPADLAWTQGKASWQPLSVLLHLNTTQPPPVSGFPSKDSENGTNVPNFVLIPGLMDEGPTPNSNLDDNGRSRKEGSEGADADSTKPEDSAPPDVVLAAGESLLCRSDSVVVTTSRLVVNDHTFSLEGVTEAKLDVIYTKCNGYYGIARVFYWVGFWVFSAVLVGSLFVGGFEWKMLIFPPFCLYGGLKESREAPWNHYNNAKITLTQAGRRFVCYSKACCVHPDLMKGDKMADEDRERMKSDLFRDLGTAKAISDAISVAIASRKVNRDEISRS